MFISAYLRASTEDRSASRARDQLDQFAVERDQVIAAYYVENGSGASLKRPELFRLLSDGRLILPTGSGHLSKLVDWR